MVHIYSMIKTQNKMKLLFCLKVCLYLAITKADNHRQSESIVQIIFLKSLNTILKSPYLLEIDSFFQRIS